MIFSVIFLYTFYNMVLSSESVISEKFTEPPPDAFTELFYRLWMWLWAASEVLFHVFQQQLHEAAQAQNWGGPAQSWTLTNARGCFKQFSPTLHFLLGGLCFKGLASSIFAF